MKQNWMHTDPPPTCAVTRDARLLAQRSVHPENCPCGNISTVYVGAAGIFNFERYISGWVKDEKRPHQNFYSPIVSPTCLATCFKFVHEGRETGLVRDVLVGPGGGRLGLQKNVWRLQLGLDFTLNLGVLNRCPQISKFGSLYPCLV